MKLTFIPFALTICALALAPVTTAQTATDAELKRKAEEVERLKRELERAQSELKSLSEENQRLRNENSARAKAAPARVVENPSQPMDALPPLKPDTVVDARDLVLYFQANPSAAEQRFKKQTFRIKGTIDGFEPKMFLRKYEVLLESPDRQMKVVCRFGYAPEYDAVIAKRKGNVLVARTDGKELQLLEGGREVIIQGRCEGFQDSHLEFSRCEVVR
jgi:hypothetical protein